MLESIYVKLNEFDILIPSGIDEQKKYKFLTRYNPGQKDNLHSYYIPGLNIKNDGFLNKLADILVNEEPLEMNIPEAYRSYLKVDIHFVLDGVDYSLMELIGYITDFHKNVIKYEFEDQNTIALYVGTLVSFKLIPEIIRPYIEEFEKYFKDFNDMNFNSINFYQKTKKSAMK